jgi:hypothetical protein
MGERKGDTKEGRKRVKKEQNVGDGIRRGTRKIRDIWYLGKGDEKESGNEERTGKE